MKDEYDILMADLCARLPYGVKYRTHLGDVFTLKSIDLETSTKRYIDNNWLLPEIKPLLIPYDGSGVQTWRWRDLGTVTSNITYLLEHHFDFNGLIGMGFAEAAPKGLYEFYK
jgi:hypothetical protein